MKKYLILILLICSVNGFSQEIKDSLKGLKIHDISFINAQKKDSIFHLNINNTKNKILHNKKLDFFNPNFPKYNYDIYNPNKSNDVVGFLLSGISNLF